MGRRGTGMGPNDFDISLKGICVRHNNYFLSLLSSLADTWHSDGPHTSDFCPINEMDGSAIRRCSVRPTPHVLGAVLLNSRLVSTKK